MAALTDEQNAIVNAATAMFGIARAAGVQKPVLDELFSSYPNLLQPVPAPAPVARRPARAAAANPEVAAASEGGGANMREVRTTRNPKPVAAAAPASGAAALFPKPSASVPRPVIPRSAAEQVLAAMQQQSLTGIPRQPNGPLALENAAAPPNQSGGTRRARHRRARKTRRG